jgi:hypothetical protein
MPWPTPTSKQVICCCASFSCAKESYLDTNNNEHAGKPVSTSTRDRHRKADLRERLELENTAQGGVDAAVRLGIQHLLRADLWVYV